MQISASAQQLLKFVFTASSAQRVLTRPHLERQTGLSTSELNLALEELSARGLLDARRLRLTLPGLALAVACGARGRRPARKQAARVARRRIESAPIALFSPRELPRAVA